MLKTYSASAGSGKTFNLVVEYLTICLKNLCRRDLPSAPSSSVYPSREAFRQILAITFTNNAAAEMKKRIMDVLREFAFTPAEEPLPICQRYFEKISEKIFADMPDMDERQQRQTVRMASVLQLQSILYDYDRFAVTTIDSFNQRIIRSSALRLGLDLNYAVEVDLDEFYAQIIDQIIDELKKDQDFTRSILWILNSEMSESGKSDMGKVLLSTLDILYNKAEAGYDYIERLRYIDKNKFEAQIKEWHQYVHETIPKELKTTLLPLFSEVRDALEQEKGVPKDGVAVNPYNRIGKFIKDINLFLSRKKEEQLSNQRNLDLFRSKGYLKKNASLDEDSEAIIERKMAELDQWIDQYMVPYYNACLLLKYSDKLLILFDVQQKMQELKELRGLFFLAESNILLHQELSQTPKGLSPVIYEKQGFNHFFFDEFQDTSRMQWHNLQPLVENNAITQQGDVFLFGDVKQAIYRWRNGDAQILRDLSAYETQNAHGFGFATLDKSAFSLEPLKTNYRTLKMIVNFNNGFFRDYSKALSCSEMYDNVEQDAKSDEPGLVQVSFYGTKESKAWPVVAELPEKYASLDRFLEEQAESIPDCDRETLYAVRDALSRGYLCSDILILARMHTALDTMAQLLIKAGLQAETKQSLSLEEAPEVMAVVNTLRLLLDPEDKIAKTMVLYTLSRCRNGMADFVAQIPSSASSMERFQETMEQQCGQRLPLEKWQQEPLYVTVLDIIRLYGLDQKQSPFLNDFLDFVLDDVTNRKGNVQTFLARWDFLSEKEKIPSVKAFMKNDAVSLMTIHGAKGLERPVVIYQVRKEIAKDLSFWTEDVTDLEHKRVAYLEGNEQLFSHSDFYALYQQQEQKAREDALNLAYVAHTRPKEMLYIVSSQLKTEPDSESYVSFLQKFVKGETETSRKDPSLFTSNRLSEAHYCFGDYDWRKRKPADEEDAESMVVLPQVKISDFTMEDLVPVKAISEEDARSLGTKVHDYLARLSTFPQTDEEVEAAKADIPSELQSAVLGFFTMIKDDETLRPFFGPDAKVYNEVSILTPDGLVKRPDRVAFLDGQVRVFDYKTGEDKPQYHEQIEEYCRLLREMGYQHVQGQLLFPQ